MSAAIPVVLFIAGLLVGAFIVEETSILGKPSTDAAVIASTSSSTSPTAKACGAFDNAISCSTQGQSSSQVSATSQSTSAEISTSIAVEHITTYALNPQDTIELGWSLDNGYSSINSFALEITNTGQNVLSTLTYSIAGVIGQFTEKTPIAPGAIGLYHVEFKGGITCNAGFCLGNGFADANGVISGSLIAQANVTFSDGQTFSIPQQIHEGGGSVKPYSTNTESAFCSALLRSVTVLGSSLDRNITNISGGVGWGLYVTLRNSNASPFGVAAWTLVDPLNSNGLSLQEISNFDLSSPPIATSDSTMTVTQTTNSQGIIVVRATPQPYKSGYTTRPIRSLVAHRLD